VKALAQAFNLRANFRDIWYRPSDHFTVVDGLRAWSIIYVVIYHALMAIFIGHQEEFLGFIQQTPWYFQWVLMGDRGVDSFFVISGFLIAQMLFREQAKSGTISIKRFYWRRFLRLAPVYYLVLVLFALFAGPMIVSKIMLRSGVGEEEAVAAFTQHMLAFAVYLNNFLPMKDSHIHIAWSLAVEEQFYILFSLFLLFFFYKIRQRLLLLVVLFIASFLVRLGLFLQHPELLVGGDLLLAGPPDIVEPYWEIIYDNLYSRFGSILPGVILAYLYVHHWEEVKSRFTTARINMIVLAGVVMVFGTSVFPAFSGQEFPLWVRYFFHVCHHNLYATSIAFFLLAGLLSRGMGEWINRFFSARIFYPIAQLSYSIYLVHLPLVVLTGLALRGMGLVQGLSFPGLLLIALVSFVPILLVTSLLYVFVERPFMKMRG
jgi:peptidoglycan/LPS O-acetylase OafA/YrhL